MKQIRSCFSLSKKKYLLFLCVVLAAVIVSGSLFFLCRAKNGQSQTEQNQLLTRISSDLSGSFRANLNISWNDFSASAAFEQRYIGDCTLRFLSPPALEGFEILLSEQNISLSYRGISCQTDSDGLFSSSGAGMLIDAFQRLSEPQSMAAEEKDGILTLTDPSQTFFAEFDTESGELLKIHFPSENLSVKFSEFSVI